jgi:type I restriction-modification system DNA methylase subunit
MAKGNSQKKADGSALDFEAQLWATAEQAVPAPNYPPFNMSDWSRGGGMRQDVRCFSLSASIGERAGVRCRIHPSPVNNANYAWIQHFIHHLSPVGVAGFVKANGNM